MPEEEKKVTGEKIYWAPARKYRLHLSKKDPDMVGGEVQFQKELRDMRGNVVKVSAPIIFGENMFVTKDADVQTVIEKSKAFRDGEIILCQSIDQANALTVAKDGQLKISSGMVTMLDDAGNINTPQDAQKELGKIEQAAQTR